jgi:glycosyltransferase involved in cell wall biosynthesis
VRVEETRTSTAGNATGYHPGVGELEAAAEQGDGTTGEPRIGVLVVAFNAEDTLAAVLDRLPPAFRQRLAHVLVSDDASHDATHDVGLAYQARGELPLTVIRHDHNLGYGGNQKSGYRSAIEHGLDVVVLLHGDGQYAPEVIEDLVGPLVDGQADAVFGSRMLTRGAARAGGMPLYKFAGNRILTTVQNALVGLELSEWHSGYRAYRVDALVDIPFETYSDGFDFDTEIILGLHAGGKTIAEVPIPTYYGDEICYVNGMRYAKDVTADVLRFRLQRMGFGPVDAADASAYELKLSSNSSHSVLLRWLAERGPGRVLDVGCSDGQFGSLVKSLGHHVTGVDVVKHEGVGERLDGFVDADLNHGLPAEAGDHYDCIVAADVLEHTVVPDRLLTDIASRLAPDGVILVSVPNFAHWYPRARVAAGRFDYDQRGLLDRGHVRFFTRRSFERLVGDCRLRIVRRAVVGSPIEDVLDRGGSTPVSRVVRAAAAVDRAAARVWPTMFGYQFLYELKC